MIREYLIIRTTISRALSRHVLIKGFCIALLGIAALFAGGIFLPLPSLQKWGWLLFIISLGLIALGLLPYRRLVRLQLKPNELSLLDTEELTFKSRGRNKLTIPLESVSKMEYVDHPLNDGIAIWLIHPPPSPVVVHESPKEIELIRKQGKENGNADLFFAHFNRHAYDELIEWLKDVNE